MRSQLKLYWCNIFHPKKSGSIELCELGRAQGNNQGTSLVEAMTQLEISLHLESLRTAHAAPASGGKAAGAASELPNWQDDNACAACGQTRLTFEPPSVYCTSCAQRIKRSQARALV